MEQVAVLSTSTETECIYAPSKADLNRKYSFYSAGGDGIYGWSLQASSVSTKLSETPATTLCHSSHNSLIYFASEANLCSLELNSGKTSILYTAQDEINDIDIHMRQPHFISVADDTGAVTVIDLRSNMPFKRPKSKHESIALCAKFRPHQAWQLFSGGIETSVRQWDFSRGSVLGCSSTIDENYNAAFNPPYVYSLQFEPSAGNLLAAGLGNGQIKLWSCFKSKSKLDEWRTFHHQIHSWNVSSLAWNVSGSLLPKLISVGIDKKLIATTFCESLSEVSSQHQISIGCKPNAVAIVENGVTSASKSGQLLVVGGTSNNQGNFFIEVYKCSDI